MTMYAFSSKFPVSEKCAHASIKGVTIKNKNKNKLYFTSVLKLGCMRGIKSLNSYAIHLLINKLFIYKGDMSFKNLNISMAKILKRDRNNVLFDAFCNKLQYVSLKSLRT